MMDEPIDDELVKERWIDKLHLSWLYQIIIKPRRTLAQVVEAQHAAWLAPLLLLSLLALLLVRVSGMPRRIATNIEYLPPDYEYYTPEQQQQFQQAVEARRSHWMIYYLPALGELSGIWLGWVLTGSALHLALTLTGSRSGSRAAYNLAGWAMMPLAFRFIVQTVGTAATQQLISQPGLSGFVGSAGGSYLGEMLSQVDIYFIWHVILLMIGALLMSGLSRRRAWLATAGAVVVVMALNALPGFLIAQLSDLGSSQSFFFF